MAKEKKKKESIIEQAVDALERKKKSYEKQVFEAKSFYERKLEFAESFKIPGYDYGKDEDESSSEDSSGVGTGADIEMGTKYDKEINAAAKKYGLNPYFIASIIKQESNFDANAGSGAGARGLMQLMPATARSLGVSNVTDPGENVMGGTKYIKQMLEQQNWNPVLALAAYNAGPGNVAKHGGVPPFKETQDYVVKIPANFKAYTGKTLDSKNVKWQGPMSSGGGKGGGEVKKGAAKDFINKWRVSADFPAYSDGTYHSGMDFAGTAGSILGTKLPNFHEGTVVVCGWDGDGYGNYIVVKTKDNHHHYYAHLQSTYVKKGDKVKVDQIIGTIGNTGNSFGPHLHYEVRPSSNKYHDALNPHKFLKGTNKGV